MENLQNLPLDAAISKLIDLIVSFGSRLLIAIIVFFVGRWIIRRIINVVVKAMQPSLPSSHQPVLPSALP